MAKDSMPYLLTIMVDCHGNVLGFGGPQPFNCPPGLFDNMAVRVVRYDTGEEADTYDVDPKLIVTMAGDDYARLNDGKMSWTKAEKYIADRHQADEERRAFQDQLGDHPVGSA